MWFLKGQDVLLGREGDLVRRETGERNRNLEAVLVELLDVVGRKLSSPTRWAASARSKRRSNPMADRNRGEKSTVRIARSSLEQNGCERHRTLPVPVSSDGTLTAARSPHSDAVRIWKIEKNFKGAVQIFSARIAIG